MRIRRTRFKRLITVLTCIGVLGVYLCINLSDQASFTEGVTYVASNREDISDRDNRHVSMPITLRTSFILNNPDLCSGIIDLEYIVLVHTSVDHFINRTWIRKTWANKATFPKGRIVFLLGTTPNKNDQMLVEKEFTEYRDIIQGNFNDSYKNLTHKGVLGLRWATQFCPQASVVIKLDDDIIFNVYMFQADFFEIFKKYEFLMMGNIIGNNSMKIIRDPSNKWYVPESEPWFVGKTKYPKYCSGLWVGMTSSLVRAMYVASFNAPFFWVDDVYLFGLLTLQVKNLTHLRFTKQVKFRGNDALKCYSNTSSYCPVMLTQCKNLPVSKCDDIWNLMKKQDEHRTHNRHANTSMLRIVA